MNLKSFQLQTIDHILQFWNEIYEVSQHLETTQTLSKDCVLLYAPTGSGKTIMASQAIEQFTQDKNIVWFWFTPFKNLVDQTDLSINYFIKNLNIKDIAKDRQADLIQNGDIFILNWQMVISQNKDSRKIRSDGDRHMSSIDRFIDELKQFDFQIGVVIDEAHHSFVNSKQAILFYQNILQPDYSLLITATPNDQEIQKFKVLAQINKISEVSVSYQDAVDAGLIKKGVISTLFLNNNQTDSVDLEKTAILQGWKKHNEIKHLLNYLNINLTPLMLIQVPNGKDSVQTIYQKLLDLNIPEEKIAIYTADEVSDDLVAIAKDNQKEILIFKVAIALGFDAPRAFTLVSCGVTKDVDFGTQMIGRILRVESQLQKYSQTIDFPHEILSYGYIFLADSMQQSGLSKSAQRINSIVTEFNQVSPSVININVNGVNVCQVDQNNQTTFLIPDEIVQKNPKLSEQIQKPSPKITEEIVDVLDNIQDAVKQSEDLFNFDPNQIPTEFKFDKKIYCYPIQFNLNPNYFYTENFKLDDSPNEVAKLRRFVIFSQQDLMQGIQGKSYKIQAQSQELFSRQFLERQEIVAHDDDQKIIDLAIKKFGIVKQYHYFELKELLKSCLKIAYAEYQLLAIAEDDSALEKAIHRIIFYNADFLSRLVEKSKINDIVCTPTAPIDLQLTFDEPLEANQFNLYGILPHGLNSEEKAFIRHLEQNSHDILEWWHRNPPKTPQSVRVILSNGKMAYPDFIVKLKHQDELLLVEYKGFYLKDNTDSREKIEAHHQKYGRIIFVTQNEHKQFFECDLVNQQVELVRPFNLKHFLIYQ